MAELTPLVEAWIRYAEDDWQDSLILASAGRNGRSICFHVQQCIEKLFKAELMRMALPVPKTQTFGSSLIYCTRLTMAGALKR